METGWQAAAEPSDGLPSCPGGRLRTRGEEKELALLVTELKRISMWTPGGLLEHLNVEMGYNPDV